MSRLRKYEEPENHERWLVSYADFITLLFAFFVVLFATSSADLKKQEEFQESVREKLSFAAGLMGGGQSLQRQDGDALGVAPEAGTELIESPLFEAQGQMPRWADEIAEALAEKLESENFEVEASRNDIRLLFPEDLLFQKDSELTRNAVHHLEAIADVIRKYQVSVIVEGHSDDQTPQPWRFSTQRAVAIVEALVQHDESLHRHLQPTGLADQRPRWPNHTAQYRKQNRRIELALRP